MQSTILKSRNAAFLVAALFLVMSFPLVAMAFEKEVNDLSQRMSEKIVQAGKKRVAVVDFTDLGGRTTELGRFLAEEFSVAIASSGKGFEVVDRTHLKSIIQEHKLSATGLIDPSTARKLGKIAGVEALITGTITPFGDSVRLSVKVLDTATAKVIAAERGNIAKTQAIQELLSREIDVGTSGSSGAVRSRGNTPSFSGQRQEFPRFSVEVVDLRKMSGNKVELVLNYVNKKQKELLIGFPDWCSNTTTLSDDKGNDYRCDSTTGIARYLDRKGSGGLTLPGGGSAMASFRFNPPRQMESVGSTFTFNSTQNVLESLSAGKPRFVANYSISMVNISAK